ncbi:galactonate dehydratase [Longispora fulva]|uniref:Galactonate dehydratase n=1 Tax=Longispora fulva TaxID=619741 RepID=A0A8J7GQ59_9ACTN|nr:enolase C-terminal domain-like protein [Longispora fulva]MBG6136003.1 galactonate dehydratase [Longispora fulva]GIG55755.1 galactonate dehydratase [Longispora fulva]
MRAPDGPAPTPDGMGMIGNITLYRVAVSPRTSWLVLAVSDRGGVTGLGECSDAGAVGLVAARMSAWWAMLRSRDVLAERDAVLEELALRVTGLTDATVLGGLDQALSDLAARREGVPLWKWLGGSDPGAVDVYANINRAGGGREPSDVASVARAAVAAGFRAVKLAPFDVPGAGRLADIGLARVRAVRDAVGDDVDVMVDCHERLALDELDPILDPLADLGLLWLEDAVAIDRVEELRQLRSRTPLRLAGGEFAFAPGDVAPAVEAGVVDVLMPDVKHAGGLRRALALARVGAGTAVSLHNPCGPVATAASAHLTAACPGAIALEYAFGEVGWRADLVGGAERITDGRLAIAPGPGLGLDLDKSLPSVTVVWSTR